MKKVKYLAFAQTSAQLTKDLGEFSTIKIYDRLTVSLISSSENLLERNREGEINNKTESFIRCL
jgi:hypothetical protein